MAINVLGICGSPFKGGNTELFLKAALAAAAESPDATTTLVSLAGKDIRDCTQCNWCARKQDVDRLCQQQDDMAAIYPELVKADVILIATPVYFARLSGVLACFIDRLRCFYLGKVYSGRMTNKVGGALAVSWLRNRGIEPALNSIVVAFMALAMVPVSPPLGGSPLGAAGLSSKEGTGEYDRGDRVGVLKDRYGLQSAESMARRAVEVAKLLKR